jgi:mitochondrial fusion and transport protein UGO1
MDKDRFHPLSTSREPNPLRPYYVPPSIGPTASTSPSQPLHTARHSTPSSSFSTSARDLLPELDIDLKSTTSEAWQQTRSLVDTLVWRYSSILLAQPFDVAKTVLQVSLPPSQQELAPSRKRRTSPKRAYSNGHVRGDRSSYGTYDDRYSDEEMDEGDQSDQSDDMPDYFTSTAPRSRSPRKRRRTPPSTELSPSPTPTPKDRREHDPGEEDKLRLKKSDSVTHAISALYNTSGAVGLWRATNCTFIYSILLRTTDSFVRSLLLAIVGLPDIVGPDAGGLGPGLTVAGSAGFSGLDLSESPNPLGSLVIVGLASCITGLLLAPLDLVRTRLIVTPTSHPPRGLVQNLRQLPSLLAPSTLWLPTALYHAIPQTFSAASPLILRRQLRITPETTPSLWSLAAFTTSVTELFVRLPLETILRRAQVSSLKHAEPEAPTIVETAPYIGVWATVYSILYTEGETSSKDARGMIRIRRGQGASGLVRGWRIGFWGVVGVWGFGALGPGEGKGRGEF